MSRLFEFFLHHQLKTQEEVNRYHASPAFGHTKIVNFETYGPTTLRDDFVIKPTESMMFGSLVDCLLTRSNDFLSSYYVPTCKIKPTPSESTFVQYLVTHKINPYSLTDDQLTSILDTCKTYTIYTKNIEKRLEKAKLLYPLIDELLKNAHKQCISQQDLEEAVNCINTLKTAEVTRHIFEKPEHVLYQVELTDDYLNVHCLFDLLYFDFDNHVIHPIDLKYVSYPERDFITNSFYKFKYYRQAELYMKLLVNNCKMYIVDDDSWTIAPFKFMVICKQTLSPMLYEFPIKYDNDKLVISENKTVKRLEDVIEDIRWHLNNRQYMYDRETYIKLFQQSSNDLVTTPIINVDDETKNVVIKAPKKLKMSISTNVEDDLIWDAPVFDFTTLPTGTISSDDIIRMTQHLFTEEATNN